MTGLLFSSSAELHPVTSVACLPACPPACLLVLLLRVGLRRDTCCAFLGMKLVASCIYCICFFLSLAAHLLFLLRMLSLFALLPWLSYLVLPVSLLYFSSDVWVLLRFCYFCCVM